MTVVVEVHREEVAVQVTAQIRPGLLHQIAPESASLEAGGDVLGPVLRLVLYQYWGIKVVKLRL